jgi:hypothetical protein
VRLRARKNFFAARREKVARKFAGFIFLPYLCRRDKDNGSPFGGAHDRRSANKPGIFYAQQATDKTAAIPKELIAHRVKSLSLSQRDVQPFLCTPTTRFVDAIKIMQK